MPERMRTFSLWGIRNMKAVLLGGGGYWGCGSCRTTDSQCGCACVFVCTPTVYVYTCCRVCVSALMLQRWWLWCQPAPPASWLCTQSHSTSPAAVYVRSTEAQVFLRTNTLQPASQLHHWTWHTGKGIQSLCSPPASEDWTSFSARSSLTSERLLIGKSCKMNNFCSVD